MLGEGEKIEHISQRAPSTCKFRWRIHIAVKIRTFPLYSPIWNPIYAAERWNEIRIQVYQGCSEVTSCWC